MSRVRFYVRHIEIVESGYLETTAVRCGIECGIVGALDDRRFVGTCAWPIDLYFVAILDKDKRGHPVYRAVEVWDGVGRPRPLPMPPMKGSKGLYRRYGWLKIGSIYGSYKPGVGRLSLEVVREPGGYLKVGGRPAWDYVLGVLPDGRWVFLDDELRTYVGEFRPSVEDPLSTYGTVGRLEAEGGEVDVRQVEGPFGAPGLLAESGGKLCGGPRRASCWRDEAMWRAVLDWPLSDPLRVAMEHNRRVRAVVRQAGGRYYLVGGGGGHVYYGHAGGGTRMERWDKEVDAWGLPGLYAYVEPELERLEGLLKLLGVRWRIVCSVLGYRGPYVVAGCAVGNCYDDEPYPLFRPYVFLEGMQRGQRIYFIRFWDFRGIEPILNPPIKAAGALSRWYEPYCPSCGEPFLYAFRDDYLAYRALRDVSDAVHDVTDFAYFSFYPYAVPVAARNPRNLYTCDLETRRGEGSFVVDVVRLEDGYLRVGDRLAWHHVLGVLPNGKWLYLDDELRVYEGRFKPLVEDPLSAFGVVGRFEAEPADFPEMEEVRAPLGPPSLVACSRDLEEASRRSYERYGVEYDLSDCAPGVIWPIRVRDEALWRALLDWPLADPTPHVIRLWKQQLISGVSAYLWDTCAGRIFGNDYENVFLKRRSPPGI